MSKGIVVQNKESGIRYAVFEDAQDKSSEKKIRDLKPGESVLSYVPKAAPEGWGAEDSENDGGGSEATAGTTPANATTPTPATPKTEGSSSGDAKASK